MLLLASPQPALANADLERILAGNEAPSGIVFEIVEADDLALQQLVPIVQNAIQRLRQRFPQTEIAVVSHGREEFALQSRYQGEYAELHQQVQSL
jgi:hypothetical protein